MVFTCREGLFRERVGRYIRAARLQVFKSCSLWYIVPSSELIRCKECGQSFDTVESLREHVKSEKDEIKNRVRGLSDG